MDIFGLNVGVDSGSVLSSVGDVASSILPDNPLANLVPQGVQDALGGLASSITVSPQGPTNGTVAAPTAPKPGSAAQVMPVKPADAVVPLLGLAALGYFFLKKA